MFSSINIYTNFATPIAFTVLFPSRSLNGLVYLIVFVSDPSGANGSGFEPSTVKYISAFCVSKKF